MQIEINIQNEKLVSEFETQLTRHIVTTLWVVSFFLAILCKIYTIKSLWVLKLYLRFALQDTVSLDAIPFSNSIPLNFLSI